MTLPPDIHCHTCQVFGADPKASAADLKCADCCARHVLRTIEGLGKFGPKGHAERIRDAVFAELAKGQK